MNGEQPSWQLHCEEGNESLNKIWDISYFLAQRSEGEQERKCGIRKYLALSVEESVLLAFSTGMTSPSSGGTAK